MNKFLLLLMAGCLSSLALAESIPHLVPSGVRSYYWSALVDGREIGVCRARTTDAPWQIRSGNDHGGEYAVAAFDMTGSVRLVVKPIAGGAIRPIPDLSKTQILPASAPVKIVRKGADAVDMEIFRPCMFSVEPNGVDHPLVVLARAVESDIPDSSDPKVRVLGPGIVAPADGVINLGSDETLYLRSGTVLKAAIEVKNAKNVRICGRGLLDGSDFPWGRVPRADAVSTFNCKNVRIEGITIVGNWLWAITPKVSEDITIDNVAICGSRVWNDDGIDIVNCRRVNIRNSFVRTDDDCFCMKGFEHQWGDCMDVTVEHCVLWCDRARAVLLAWIESACNRMANLTFRDNDIIHFRGPAIMAVPIHSCRMENILFEDVRIHNDRATLTEAVIKVFPTAVKNRKMRRKAMSNEAGEIDGFTFRNITFEGVPAEVKNQFDDGKGCAPKNLVLENFMPGCKIAK